MDWEKALLRGKDIKDSLKELESQIDMLQDDKEYYRRLYVEARDEKFKDEEMKRLREELEFADLDPSEINDILEKYICNIYKQILFYCNLFATELNNEFILKIGVSL